MSDGFRAYKRGQILQALKDRLTMIQRDAGYQTDAGKYVSLGRARVTGDDAFPRLSLVTGETQTPAQGKGVQRRLPVTVEGLAKATKDDPLAAVEELLGDIKRALFLPADKTLGGLLSGPEGLEYGEERHIDVEEGGSFVGCQVDAVATYVEKYGEPEAA